MEIFNYIKKNTENLIYVMIAILILLVALFMIKSVEAECHTNYQNYINTSCLCFYEGYKDNVPDYKIPVEVNLYDNKS